MKSLMIYWSCFAASLTYWELLLKWIMGGVTDGGFYFLCFVPAAALILAFLEGWLREKANRIFLPLLLLPLTAYYALQVGYYRVFGSLFSVSMLGMGGEAVADFGWTIRSVIASSIGELALTAVPFFLAAIASIFTLLPQKPYSVLLHICAFVFTPTLLLLGIATLLYDGTSRQSAYYAFSNSLMDTDSTSRKIGALVTSLIETGSYVFGVGGGQGTELLAQELSPTAPVLEGYGEDSGEPDTQSSELPEDGSVIMPDAIPNPGNMILEEIDFPALASLSDDPSVQALCNYFSNVKGTTKNQMSGRFAGYNLIYICAESFWTYAVNETVTPTLYKLANNGIVLENYYNSFKNTTTNGEFAFLTSLWPDVSRDAMRGKDVGSFPQSASNYMPYGLGNISQGSGYKAYGFHNYKGSYYRRDRSLPNLGLTCKFMGAGMRFTSSWPSSDLEMMQQSVDDYISDERFIAYYMTFSGHGPYDDTNYICKRNWSETAAAVNQMGYSDLAVGYLSCYREFDKAMEYLLNRLEEAGIADRTLIVIAGDHYPYYLLESARDSLAGHKIDEDFEMYKSTCILYNAGMTEPVRTDICCCNVDLLPTILNLLDIPYDSRMLAGTDIFSDGFHKATLYNKSFITDRVKYNASTGKTEWLTDVSDCSEAELSAYVESVSRMIDTEYAASLQMMDCNFYRFVWENAQESE